jgi:hypothetical protein
LSFSGDRDDELASSLVVCKIAFVTVTIWRYEKAFAISFVVFAFTIPSDSDIGYVVLISYFALRGAVRNPFTRMGGEGAEE